MLKVHRNQGKLLIKTIDNHFSSAKSIGITFFESLFNLPCNLFRTQWTKFQLDIFHFSLSPLLYYFFQERIKEYEIKYWVF